MVGLGRDFIANARLTFPQTSKISGPDSKSDLDPELKEYKVKDGLNSQVIWGHWKSLKVTCYVPKNDLNSKRLKNNLKWYLSELTNKFISLIRKANPLAVNILSHHFKIERIKQLMTVLQCYQALLSWRFFSQFRQSIKNMRQSNLVSTAT